MMGKSFRVVERPGVRRLERCDAATADLVVPDADYLLTLDADSLVLRTYMLKLVTLMEHDRQVAVAQTPYSAVPGSRNRLERAAGAQTDVHTSFTRASPHSTQRFGLGQTRFFGSRRCGTSKPRRRKKGKSYPFSSRTGR
jgi:hypothetical protein